SGGSDRARLRARLVQQVARKLAAGARKVRPVAAMLAHDMTDPPLRAEHDREQEQYGDAGDDRHGGFLRPYARPPGERTPGRRVGHRAHYIMAAKGRHDSEENS